MEYRLVKDNVERVVSDATVKDRLVSDGYKEITQSKAVKKSKTTEGA